jgi:hypothetical protein
VRVAAHVALPAIRATTHAEGKADQVVAPWSKAHGVLADGDRGDVGIRRAGVGADGRREFRLKRSA